MHLLQSILPDLGITVGEVTPQKQLNKKLLEKNVIMDLWAKNKDGKIFDVEMQTTKQKWPGEDLDQIGGTYIIFIYPFDPFGEGKYIYEGAFLLDKDNPDSQANTKTHWISINARGYKGKITAELKDFLNYIKYGLTKDSSNFIKKIDRERLDYIRSTEWRDAKMSLDVLLTDERTEARKEGRRQGRKEGREEGIVEGKLEGKLEAQRIGVKKFVQNVRELDQSDDWIMSKLIKDYGKDFSEAELKKVDARSRTRIVFYLN